MTQSSENSRLRRVGPPGKRLRVTDPDSVDVGYILRELELERFVYFADFMKGRKTLNFFSCFLMYIFDLWDNSVLARLQKMFEILGIRDFIQNRTFFSTCPKYYPAGIVDHKKSLDHNYVFLNPLASNLIEKLKSSKDSVEIINIYHDIIVYFPFERQQILLKAGLQSALIPRDHIKQ